MVATAQFYFVPAIPSSVIPVSPVILSEAKDLPYLSQEIDRGRFFVAPLLRMTGRRRPWSTWKDLLRFSQATIFSTAVVREHQYFVYIATNGSKTLYTGVAKDLKRRMFEHGNALIPGFTSKYRIDRLVYFESTFDVRAAIAREKQIKGWRRERKISLIEGTNPKWRDLSKDWN